MRQRFDQDVTNNREGMFTFNSLADLENDQPASFTRTLAPAIARGARSIPRSISATRGGRAARCSSITECASRARRTEARRPRTRSSTPRSDCARTIFPSEVHLSPRVGFTWTLGQGGLGAPTTIIRGGAGEFRSLDADRRSSRRPRARRVSTGSESQLVCIGSAVPTPDWSAYASDPSVDPDLVRVRNAAAHRAARCRTSRRSIRTSARRVRGAHRSACSGAFSIASA